MLLLQAHSIFIGLCVAKLPVTTNQTVLKKYDGPQSIEGSGDVTNPSIAETVRRKGSKVTYHDTNREFILI